MERPIVIAGNWKMHLGIAGGRAFLDDFVPRLAGLPDRSRLTVLLAPNLTLLAPLADACGAADIRLAAQNCHPADAGAFTGETSVAMIRETGAGMVLVGHSERRQFFGDTDDFVRDKLRAVLNGGLEPILCVGETLAEREAGQAAAVVSRQLESALDGLPAAVDLMIAYEPVWAIGTGRTATPDDAGEMHVHIRNELCRLLPAIAARLPILYGGSVKPDNAAEIMSREDIDGVLVGGASLAPASFAAIAAAAPVSPGHHA
ncbi:MAG: triose-phosphate isomerase [Deltaproteobacteria bacterium]|nr:triose-phosphate isomerase [Candidatus Anaeroferrophillacea bacterium]